MIGGTAYGVILNDRYERERLVDSFSQPPYGAAPVSPPLYIKPRNTFSQNSAIIPVPGEMVVGATCALLFGAGQGAPVALAIAIDLYQPHGSYYRPAIRERCRDGSLPIGTFLPWDESLIREDFITAIDGTDVHRWNLSRLLRAPLDLVRDLGAYMTLADGDVLLPGVAGDAPLASPGQKITVSAGKLPELSVSLTEEDRS